jgi:hypothetical protein
MRNRSAAMARETPTTFVKNMSVAVMTEMRGVTTPTV